MSPIPQPPEEGMLSAAAFPGGPYVNAGGLLACEGESDTLETAQLQDLTLQLLEFKSPDYFDMLSSPYCPSIL